MVDIQILSKVLNTGNIELIVHNGLNSDYFPNYSEEFKFLMNHYKQFNKVPDKETFLAQFPDFNIIQVQEADTFLLEKISEEYLYNKSVPVLKKVEELIQKDSRKAAFKHVINIASDSDDLLWPVQRTVSGGRLFYKDPGA